MSNSSKIDIVSTQKRMLVVLDCFQDHQAILNIASHLAVKQKMEISALFVEDVNLVHLAGLPFAREVDRVNGRWTRTGLPAPWPSRRGRSRNC